MTSAIGDLALKSKCIRNNVIDVAVGNGAGHLAPSLSCIDILVSLYYEVLRFRPEDPHWEDRDRVIFAKAHGVYGLYAILCDLGVIPRREWELFYKEGSTLAGCAERKVDYGLEVGCGSLGHGLPMAVGLAHGARVQGRGYHVWCVIGDGELQEGSTWEALMYARKHGLSNLSMIVDKNGLQAMDRILDVLDVEEDDCENRLRGFGLDPVLCDGHDLGRLVDILKGFRRQEGAVPSVLVAKTIKGFGLPRIENTAKFHFRIPTPDELQERR